jgi:hypothetical protein
LELFYIRLSWGCPEAFTIVAIKNGIAANCAMTEKAIIAGNDFA